jgi:hypothetical protein
VEQCGARHKPRFGVHDRGEGLVVDVDQVQRIPRAVGIGGNDHRDRLADVTHPIRRQRVLDGRLQPESDTGLEGGRGRPCDGKRPQDVLEVRVREAADHPGMRPRPVQPKAPDPGMGVRAP